MQRNVGKGSQGADKKNTSIRNLFSAQREKQQKVGNPRHFPINYLKTGYLLESHFWTLRPPLLPPILSILYMSHI